MDPEKATEAQDEKIGFELRIRNLAIVVDETSTPVFPFWSVGRLLTDDFFHNAGWFNSGQFLIESLKLER